MSRKNVFVRRIVVMEKGEKESIGLQESERVKSLWNPRHNTTMMVFLLPFTLRDKISSGVYKDVIHCCLNMMQEYCVKVMEQKTK